MPVTIKDVARKLDLSIATVSRALDGYTDISVETRKRVAQVAQEMGYIPNRAARQLRRRRADAIGYVLPAGAPRFTSHFHSEFISGLGDEISLIPYDLVISSAAAESDQEKRVYQNWASSRKVDGFILTRVRINDWRVQFLSEQKVPFTAMDMSQDGISYPFIETHSTESMRELVSYMVGKGFHNFGFIGGPDFLKFQFDRLAGFKQVLHESGISVKPDWIVSGNLSSEGGYEAARKLLRVPDPPKAIICINDDTAFGAMRAIREMGLKVGHEVAVTGFDGVPFAEFSDPPLTTQDYPVYDMARQLVSILVAMLDGKELPNPCPDYKPILQKRASSGD